MSLDTLLEAAKYLDHIETRDNGDADPNACDIVISRGHPEEREEVVNPSTYHLKVDPNLPISVQFHTYTLSGVQSLQPLADNSPYERHSILVNNNSPHHSSTKRNAQMAGQHANGNGSQLAVKGNNGDAANKNKDHSSYSRHREMHKTLEKNRRAHLRHCFEILKDELPPSEYNEKKTSHINIIRCAIRYISHLKRTESEMEYETERLTRAKTRFENQIAQLKEDLKELSKYHNNNAEIESLLQIEPNNTDFKISISPDSIEYDNSREVDEQSDAEVIIELETEDCYDDETTTTASECADDIRDNSNSTKINGSLTNPLIYKCHA